MAAVKGRLLYVAGKWGDRSIISSVMAKLRGMGHTITHDWTAIENADERTTEERANHAMLDIEGVRAASMLVIFVTDPNYAYRGTCTELGAALALGIPVVVVDPYPESSFSTNIFVLHKGVTRLDRLGSLFGLLDAQNAQNAQNVNKKES